MDINIKNNEPLISIVMPVYNTESYLPQAIESLLNQSFKYFEVIFVDDGSTDSSVSIIKSYLAKDSRLALIIQENGGAGKARNVGMDNAKGKYILFLDSDDFFEPSLLESTFQRAEATEADIVIYASRLYNNKKKVYEACNWAFQKEDYPFDVFCYKDNPDRILNSFQLCPWNKLFRRSFILDNNIRWQEIRRTNDFFFCAVAMILAERIALVDKVLINYRTETGTSLQSTNYKNPLDFYIAVKKFYDFLIASDRLKDIEKSYYTRALRVCLYNLGANIRNGNDDSVACVYEFIKYYGFEQLGITNYIAQHPEQMDELTAYNRIMSNSLLHVLPGYKQIEKEKKKLANTNAKLTKDNKRILKDIDELTKDNKRLMKDVDRTSIENKKLKKKIENMENSISFRLGRAITYLPRKMRDFFK